jgi:hypothetical protein
LENELVYARPHACGNKIVNIFGVASPTGTTFVFTVVPITLYLGESGTDGNAVLNDYYVT